MAETAPARNDVEAEAIRAALERVLASRGFAKTAALSAFLRYVVEETIAGNAGRLKAYTIAVEALGRPSTFDPQSDPIVRIQAGRLRKALAHFNQTEGREDPLKIELPIGSYVPRFIKRPDQSPPIDAVPRRGFPVGTLGWAVAGGALLALAIWVAFDFLSDRPNPPVAALPSPLPSITVTLAASPAPGGFDPRLLKQALESALARFDETVVLEDIDPRASHPAKYDIRMEIVQSGATSMRIRIAALRFRDRMLIWSQTYDVPVQDRQRYDDLEIVRIASAELAQPYGAIYSAERQDAAKSDDVDCIIRAFDYFRRPDKDELLHARICLEWMVTSRPDSHIAHALLSYILLEPYRDGYKPRAPEVLVRALGLARTAVKLAPQSARSHQALMAALFVFGDSEEALAEGRRGVSLNPNDSEIVRDYGCRLIYRGRYEEGRKLAETDSGAIGTPSVPQDFCLFLAAYLMGDDAAEGAQFSRLREQPGLLAAIAAAMHYGKMSASDDARRAIDRLVAFSPGFAANPQAMLLRRGWSQAVVDKVMAALIAAGLDQPTDTASSESR